MTPAIAIVAVAIAIGVWWGITHPADEHVATSPAKIRPRETRSGWVYFAGGEDTPIKIGMSQYEPTSQRLAELKSMSPVPLKLYYSQWYADRFAAEATIHEELKDSRLHGEWFDRDVALYYAALLRGEV